MGIRIFWSIFTFFALVVVVFTVSGVIGIEITYTHFKVFQKHQALRTCIETALNKNDYIGVRVNESTGDCQRLNNTSWSLNETKERGFAYARKIAVKKLFQPAMEISGDLVSRIPWSLDTGVQIEAVVSCKGNAQDVALSSDRNLNGGEGCIIFSVSSVVQIIQKSEDRLNITLLPYVVCNDESLTISWLSKNGSVTLYYAEEFDSFQPDVVDIRRLEYFIVTNRNNLILYKIQYNEK